MSWLDIVLIVVTALKVHTVLIRLHLIAVIHPTVRIAVKVPNLQNQVPAKVPCQVRHHTQVILQKVLNLVRQYQVLLLNHLNHLTHWIVQNHQVVNQAHLNPVIPASHLGQVIVHTAAKVPIVLNHLLVLLQCWRILLLNQNQVNHLIVVIVHIVQNPVKAVNHHIQAIVVIVHIVPSQVIVQNRLIAVIHQSHQNQVKVPNLQNQVPAKVRNRQVLKVASHLLQNQVDQVALNHPYRL